MSEDVQPVAEQAPVSRAEAVEAAWAKANPPAEAAEAAPAPEAAPAVTAASLEEKPERQSVAGSIRQFIKAQAKPVAAEPTGLEAEVQQLRAALDDLRGKGTPELSKEELLLQKFDELQAQQARQLEEEQAAKEQEAFQQQVAALRAGALENINAVAETEYPGLAALEQQETVVNALFQRLEEGVETSEDEIASEVESGLREVYTKLHAVYGGSQPSEAPAAASERQQTLTPGLTGADEQADLSKMTRQEKIDYLWKKSKTA